MVRVRKIFILGFHNFRKWPVNPRVYIVFLLVLAYVQRMISPIGTFCDHFGYKVGPWLFPFLMEEPYSVLMLMLCLILLFCDAPFIESEQPYLILRSGRTTWAMGQVLYMMFGSFLYFFVIYVLTVILIFPYIGLEDGWGKVINTFCQTGVQFQHGIVLPFSYTISNSLGPVQALLLDFILCWLIGFFLGLILFCVNMLVNRNIGSICASFLAIFPLFIRGSDWGLHYISPVSWLSLSVVDLSGTTTFPSLTYAVAVLCGGCILLVFLLVFATARRDIEILKSV